MDTRQYVIIGASSGIGLALTHQLLEEGHQVTAFSRTQGDLPVHGNLTYHALDIVNDDLDKSLLPDSIDGLAYCPGSITLKPFRSIKADQFREDFEINVLGAVKAIQAAQRGLKKSGNGSVVLFSTVAVQQGMPFHASIAAAKGAVEALTRSLAAEYAPVMRFNCIAPSLTDTPLAAKLLSTDDKREASAQRHPLQRVGTPEELASIASFLLGPTSSWMTGQTIGVDGGLSRVRKV